MRKFLFEQVESIIDALKIDFQTTIASDLENAIDTWRKSQDPDCQRAAEVLASNINDIERSVRDCMDRSASAMLFVLSADNTSSREILSAYEDELSKLTEEITENYGEKIAAKVKISDDYHSWREEWLELLFDTIVKIDLRATVNGPSPFTKDKRSIIAKRIL